MKRTTEFLQEIDEPTSLDPEALASALGRQLLRGARGPRAQRERLYMLLDALDETRSLDDSTANVVMFATGP